jgi:hypothetical protein
MLKKGETFQSAAEKARTESQTTQTSCFEYFVSDFCKYDAKTAYENFLNGYTVGGTEEEGPQDVNNKIVPDQDTKDRAEHLIKSLEQHIEDFTKDTLAIKSFEYTKKHEDITSSFFRDLKITNNYDESFRAAMHKIQQDPVVSKDQEFIEEFRRQGEKIKPKKRRQHSYGIQSKDGALFMISCTPEQFKDDKIKSDKLKASLVESLYGLYQKHLPDIEAPSREEIDIDVSTILLINKPSVGSSLAYDDVVEISKMAHEEATKAHHETQDLTRNKSVYKFGSNTAKELDEKVLVQLNKFKKSHKLSRTERVDIVRELIIGLNKENLSQPQKELLFDNAIKRCKEATPMERLKENGIEVHSPQDPSGQNTLASIVASFKDKLLQEPTHTQYASLLQKTYENVKRWDMKQGGDLTHERNGIDIEVTGLMKGIKSASVKEAIFEVGEKRLLYLKSKVFHEELTRIKVESKEGQQESHEVKQKVKKKIEYEVYGSGDDRPERDRTINRMN